MKLISPLISRNATEAATNLAQREADFFLKGFPLVVGQFINRGIQCETHKKWFRPRLSLPQLSETILGPEQTSTWERRESKDG